MSAVSEGDVVRIHYTGRLADGTVFDSSEGRDPLEFQLGSGQVIAGFDTAVDGMTAGESKTITIPADDAYGPRRDDLLISVPREEMPEGIEPQVGLGLTMSAENGQQFNVQISGVTDETVELDANHPLAGQDLTFDILLVGTV